VIFGTLGFLLIARSYSSIYFLLDGSSGLVRNETTYKAGLGRCVIYFPISVNSIYVQSPCTAEWNSCQLSGHSIWRLHTLCNRRCRFGVWLIRRKQFV